jgi:hypothetical protein
MNRTYETQFTKWQWSIGSRIVFNDNNVFISIERRRNLSLEVNDDTERCNYYACVEMGIKDNWKYDLVIQEFIQCRQSVLYWRMKGLQDNSILCI